jgi:hypothetical protein
VVTPESGAATAAERIVEAMTARQPALVERVLRRIRGEIAFYGSTGVISQDETRDALRSNLAYIIRNLAVSTDLDLHAPEETGRRRAAQGVPLVDLVAAYRLSFSEIWADAATVARSLAGVSADDLVDLAGRLFELHEQYTGAAVAGYRDEARELLRTSERERSVLVEVVLGGAAGAGDLWQAAESLGLPLSGSFLVVAAATPEPGNDPLPRIESALAAMDVTSVWRLEATASLGLLSAATSMRTPAVLDLLNRQATGPIGLSPVFDDLGQAGTARRLAQLALESNPQPRGVRQFPDRPLDVLVAAAPQAALGVARTVLGGLLELPVDDRNQLRGTLGAWVTAKGSARDAGAALFCHPNTVRYRLHRIESLTGRQLTDPEDLAELVAAARAWSQLPHRTSADS